MRKANLFATALSVGACFAAHGQTSRTPGQIAPAIGAEAKAGVKSPASLATPASAGAALRDGISAFRRGEYDNAAGLLQQAKAAEARLSDRDRRSLDDYIQRVDRAVRTRAQGRLELNQAEASFAEGKPEIASNLLDRVQANGFLAPDERARADALAEKVNAARPSSSPFGRLFARRRGSSQETTALKPPGDVVQARSSTVEAAPRPSVGGVATQPLPAPQTQNTNPLSKDDAKRLVAEGRRFLASGLYDQAERWAHAAKSYRGSWYFGDSPDKLLRDVQAGRAKAGIAPQGAAPTTTEPRTPAKGTPSDATRTQAPPNPMNRASTSAPLSSNATPRAGSLTRSPNGAGKAPTTREKALGLLAQARKEFQSGATDKGSLLVEQARMLNASYELLDDTPEKVLADSRRMALMTKSASTPSVPPGQTMDVGPALKSPEIVQTAAQAEDTTPIPVAGPKGVGPARDVAAEKAVKEKATKLVVAARAAMNEGAYARGVELAQQAEAMGVEFGPHEDSPEKVLRGHAAIRDRHAQRRNPKETRAKLDQARQLVAKARDLMEKGYFEQAAEMCEQAIALNAPYDINDPRPETLFAEIRARQHHAMMIKAKNKPTGEVFGGESADEPASLANVKVPAAAIIPGMAADGAPTTATPPPVMGKAPLPAPAHDKGVEPAPFTGAEAAASATPGETLKAKTRDLIGKGALAEAKRMAKTLEQSPYDMKQDAEILLASIAKAEEASQLMNAGMNAMRRSDAKQANVLFQQAAKMSDNLTPDQRQKLQELISLTSQPAPTSRPGAPGSRNMGIAKVEPGRARASDRGPIVTENVLGQAPKPGVDAPPTVGAPEPRGAVTALEPDRIQRAKDLERVEAERLRRVVIGALEDANRQQRTDPQGAVRTLESTLQTVQESPLDKDLTLPLVRQLEGRIKIYRQERRRFEAEQLEKDKQQAIAQSRRLQDQLEIDKQRQIKELSNRFRDLYNAGQYDEAEAVALQINEIDPDELFGHAALWKVQLARRYALQEEVELVKQDQWWRALYEVERADIPIPDNDIITYPAPKEWEELTIKRDKYRRSVDLVERSQAEQDIERALSRPITFEFEDTPLRDVVAFIMEYANINIILDPNGLQLVGVEPDQPVTLTLENVSLRSALNLLLDPLELTYLVRNDVLLITDKQETGGKPVPRVYPVADLVIPITSGGGFGGGGFGGVGGLGGMGGGGMGGMGGGMMGGMGGGMGGMGGGMGGMGGGMGGMGGGMGGMGGGMGGMGGGMGGMGGGMGGMGGGMGGGAGGIGAVDFESLINLITSTIEPDSWEDNGGAGTVQPFQPNLTLVVNQTEAIHEKIKDLLNQLRKLQDLQVSVEVRFITVDDTFFERIGIDFDVSFDNNNDAYINRVATNSVSPFGAFTNSTVTSPTGVPLPDGNHVRGTTFGLQPSTNAATAPRTSNFNIPLTNTSFEATRVAIAGASPTVGMTSMGIAFLNDIDVFLLLEAVQSDRRSNTLSAPKVTLFNGQLATILTARIQPFVTGARPVISAGAVAFDPTITFVTSGPTLLVQAVVSADRRYVRLTVNPTFQEIVGQVSVPITGAAGGFGGIGGGGGVGGGATASVSLSLPITSTSTVATTVSVPDGGTVLLGGLKTHQEQRLEVGTPVLSKIPYLNRLFKNVVQGRTTTSLMLMVTPRIIILEEEENKLGVSTSFGASN